MSGKRKILMVSIVLATIASLFLWSVIVGVIETIHIKSKLVGNRVYLSDLFNPKWNSVCLLHGYEDIELLKLDSNFEMSDDMELRKKMNGRFGVIPQGDGDTTVVLLGDGEVSVFPYYGRDFRHDEVGRCYKVNDGFAIKKNNSDTDIYELKNN